MVIAGGDEKINVMIYRKTEANSKEKREDKCDDHDQQRLKQQKQLLKNNC